MVAQAGFVFWTRIHTPRVAPGALPREIDLLPSTRLVGGQTWVGFRVASERSILVAQAGFVFWTRIEDAPRARAESRSIKGGSGGRGSRGCMVAQAGFFLATIHVSDRLVGPGSLHRPLQIRPLGGVICLKTA